MADIKLNGKPIKVISYGAGGTCHDNFVELWSPDFKRRLSVNQHINSDDDDPASADPADWDGYR